MNERDHRFDPDDAWPGPQLLAAWTVPTLPTEFADRVLFGMHAQRSIPVAPRVRSRVPSTVAATIAVALAMAALVVLVLAPRGGLGPAHDTSTTDAATVAHPVHSTTSLVLEVSPRDAIVRVDGTAVAGPTPFVATSLAIGPHEIQVRRDGYVPLTKVVEIDHEGLRLALALDVAEVVLEVVIDPPDADVRLLAGARELARSHGSGRFSIHRVDSEEILVEVSAGGFHARRVPVRFSGTPQDRIDVALVPDVGTAAPAVEPLVPATPAPRATPRRTAPARGDIFDPFERRGPTPPTPPPQRVSPDLQNPFHEPTPPGDISGDLKDPFHGSAPAATPTAVLRIGVVRGSGPAEVFVDARPIGSTPIGLLKVTPGTHHVRWVWSDGRVFEQSIDVAAGDTKLLKGGP